MKRAIALMLMLTVILACLPAVSLAAKQMEDGVPVWNEETVRQYALDYIEGKSMSRLWGYYDLQIRRYMPMETYEAMLTDLEWMTGALIELGSYRCFEEPENQLKTHVLHLIMEKQDLDMYFTHKNKEDDWEVMALEFVPAEKEAVSDGSDMLVGGEVTAEPDYVETDVTVGQAPYTLEGVLAMPKEASEETTVPACVFVHDFGAYDRDLTMGQTTFFADLAGALGEMGVASLRYDSRAYAYPDAQAETVWDEAVEDALAACQMLRENPLVDQERIVLVGLGEVYHKMGWAQQYHIGATRNNSAVMFNKIGPDTGFDGMGDEVFISKLSALLAALQSENALPKTVLYCLNPRDTYALCVLAGCFQKEGVKGRVQVGAAWWFLDQPDGMQQNMETQMQVGLIAQSVGMLTDSRSFLSYPRHELYRRLLCNKLGTLVESGQYPASELDTLGKIVEDICYNNAKDFFGFEV